MKMKSLRYAGQHDPAAGSSGDHALPAAAVAGQHSSHGKAGRSEGELHKPCAVLHGEGLMLQQSVAAGF